MDHQSATTIEGTGDGSFTTTPDLIQLLQWLKQNKLVACFADLTFSKVAISGVNYPDIDSLKEVVDGKITYGNAFAKCLAVQMISVVRTSVT